MRIAATLALSVLTMSAAHAAPIDIVQQQVEAYNRGDIQAFADLYAPDIELFDLGPASKPTTSGRDALITQYRPLFEKYHPRAEVLSRMTSGDFVVDRERVSAGSRSAESIAVYQVENGKIRRVWFTP